MATSTQIDRELHGYNVVNNAGSTRPQRRMFLRRCVPGVAPAVFHLIDRVVPGGVPLCGAKSSSGIRVTAIDLNSGNPFREGSVSRVYSGGVTATDPDPSLLLSKKSSRVKTRNLLRPAELPW
jgi:hypothetical protein